MGLAPHLCVESLPLRVVKYWNKLSASVVTAPLVNIFKKRLEKVWIGIFTDLPHWLNTHFPNLLIPPSPPAYRSLRATISIGYPTPFFLCGVSSGLLYTIINYCHRHSFKLHDKHLNHCHSDMSILWMLPAIIYMQLIKTGQYSRGTSTQLKLSRFHNPNTHLTMCFTTGVNTNQ